MSVYLFYYFFTLLQCHPKKQRSGRGARSCGGRRIDLWDGCVRRCGGHRLLYTRTLTHTHPYAQGRYKMSMYVRVYDIITTAGTFNGRTDGRPARQPAKGVVCALVACRVVYRGTHTPSRKRVCMCVCVCCGSATWFARYR